MNKKWKGFSPYKILGIILGNVIFAFGLAAFSIPNNFLVGGGTGVSRVLEHYFHINLSFGVTLVNASMFLVGLFVLGIEFSLTTLISTLIFPVLLNRMLAVEVFQHMTSDRLLASLAGGCLIGIGIGFVMRMGGSTGGMDIPPLALNKKLRIPVAVSMAVIDTMILLLQATFSSTEEILYGIVSALVTTTMLNQVLLYGAGNVQVLLISRNYEEINRMLQEQMDLGSTLLPIETGHDRNQQKAVLCILGNRDLGRVNQKVQQMDSHAFIIINSAREVRGRGFTFDRNLP